MHYAVTVQAFETRTTEVEVVVEAESREAAEREAREIFFSVNINNFNWERQATSFDLLPPREIQLDRDEEDSIPYIWDTNQNCEVCLDDCLEVLEYSYGYSTLDEENDPENDVDVSWNEPGSEHSSRHSVYVPVVDTFETRPTLGLPIPLTTLSNGYTPIDAEFRTRAIMPYYLNGPLPIEIGGSSYGTSVNSTTVELDVETDDDNYWNDYEESWSPESSWEDSEEE